MSTSPTKHSAQGKSWSRSPPTNDIASEPFAISDGDPGRDRHDPGHDPGRDRDPDPARGLARQGARLNFNSNYMRPTNTPTLHAL